MKRIDWIRQSGCSVSAAAEMLIDDLDDTGCPIGERDITCDVYGPKSDGCIKCLSDWWSGEIKVPAELETQTGANENITNDIVAQEKENVKKVFFQTCKRILEEVREAHKEYRTIDFHYDRPEVHMGESSFFDMFDSFEMRAEYLKQIGKYEIMASVDGVLYFCLSDNDHGLPCEEE